MYQGHRVGALLLMAGTGVRFGAPKQFAQLGGVPLYEHAYRSLKNSGFIDEIALVVPPGTTISDRPTVIGGTTRQASSENGIAYLYKHVDLILIHDGVRPFLSQRIIEQNLAKALEVGAADTCIPSADTLVHAPGGIIITSIPRRADYLRGQTPQTFRAELIHRAHQQTLETNATDDCQLVLELGAPVAVVQGDPLNLKITTPLDLKIAEFLYHQQSPLYTTTTAS